LYRPKKQKWVFNGGSDSYINIPSLDNIGRVLLNKNTGDASLTLHHNLNAESVALAKGAFDFGGYDITTTGDFTSGPQASLTGFNGTTWNISGDMDLRGSDDNLLDLRATSYSVNVAGKAQVNFAYVDGMDASAGSKVYVWGYRS
jgi:hypothetical protein